MGCDVLSALRRSFWNGFEDVSLVHAHFDTLSGLYGIKRGMGVN